MLKERGEANSKSSWDGLGTHTVNIGREEHDYYQYQL